ncbi:subtilisin-like serine protease [Tulasnella sp. 403]|nr:subtilisin-like serine protease [Tulasnella sp. 403]
MVPKLVYALVWLSCLPYGFLAAPSSSSRPRHGGVRTVQGQVIPDSYIVKLKNGVDKRQVISTLQQDFTSQFELVHDYNADFYNGFSGRFTHMAAQELSYSDHVEYVYQDGVVNATGLHYPDIAGVGVDIYVVDTGINLAHTAFEGRAIWGYSAPGLPTTDDNGHGTHCAGIAAGNIYGVARNSRLIAVKVLNSGGSGAWSDVIGGVDYVVGRYKATTIRTPSIITMSLGGAKYQPMNDAVAAAVTAGVHTVVAAGNNGQDASGFSPASAPTAITVGSIDITDSMASSSNFGTLVDIWAPGVTITSAWIGSTTATAILSGTSMATPHVAGIAAIILSQSGNLAPSVLISRLLSRADKSTSATLPIAQLNFFLIIPIPTIIPIPPIPKPTPTPKPLPPASLDGPVQPMLEVPVSIDGQEVLRFD